MRPWNSFSLFWRIGPSRAEIRLESRVRDTKEHSSDDDSTEALRKSTVVIMIRFFLEVLKLARGNKKYALEEEGKERELGP